LISDWIGSGQFHFLKKIKLSQVLPSLAEALMRREKDGGGDLGWLPVFPHVFTVSMANLLFGYHIGCVSKFYKQKKNVHVLYH
jgi:hypothetical protein